MVVNGTGTNGMRHLAGQAVRFAAISGAGWLVDFGLFALLGRLGLAYAVCNAVSALAGVTLVFFAATKRTFCVNVRRLSVRQKYAVYIAYQAVMIALASKCVGMISARFLLAGHTALQRHAGLAAKICVTPFTMTANFIFMKILTEKW